MPGPVWLAELGRPDTRRIYSNMNNSLDVRETTIGVGSRLNWWFTETELALYDSEHFDNHPNPARSCTMCSICFTNKV